MYLVDGATEPTAIVGRTAGGPAVRAVWVIRVSHGVAGTDIPGWRASQRGPIFGGMFMSEDQAVQRILSGWKGCG